MNENFLAELRNVFPAQPLTSALLADATGLWDSYGEAASFEARLKGQSWEMLGKSFTESHFAALRYMPPVAFAAFVPAYLETLLEGETENEFSPLVLSQLTRKEMWKEKFDSRVSQLSELQRETIARVLEWLAQGTRYPHYRSEIAAALSSWRQTLPRSPHS